MSVSLKVLILNHNVEWRGTFQRCYDFAKLLAARHHDVTIVTNSKTARFQFDEYLLDQIKIIRSPDLFWGILRSGWDPLNVFRRYGYLKNRKFDILHAFDNRPTVILPALWLQQKLKCPLVSDWCDWWGRGGAIRLRKNKILNFLFEPIETYFEERYRRDADFLTVISDTLKDRAIRLGCDPAKIEVIPPLAPVDKIFPIEKMEARKTLNLSNYNPILIFSGFVLYDIQMVFESYRLVHQSYPKSLLILTGGVPPALTRKFWDLPILNVGLVSQDLLQNYLGASDLCLLPLSDNLTNQARFPHKIGHYLAAGRPVVSNPVGEVGSLIQNQNIGILTDPTAESFARGICRILSEPDRLNEMGTNARSVAEKKLSGSQFSEKLEEIYFGCLNNAFCSTSNS